MHNLLTTGRGVARAAGGAALLALLLAAPAHAQTQTQTFDACYVPDIGAMYLIKRTGLPAACLSTDHVAISWTEGEVADGSVTTVKLADGAVTEVKLAFDPATQVELDALAEGATDHGVLAGLADDDHAQYLLVEGTRAGIDGFAVTGTLNDGVIPVEGAGVRLMWYPNKAAFRAGQVSGTEWDDANVGSNSSALGVNTTASGGWSTALGLSATASGPASTAMGFNTTASGASSIAMGSNTTASGLRSTAMGNGTTASGDYSTAMGFNTNARAYQLVIGRYNSNLGDFNSWVSSDALFVAGNGTSTTPSSAMILFKDGNLAIAGTLTESSDIRLKQDVAPVERALDGVLQLTPIRYRFRAGTGHPTERQIGLSAQEVEPLFPELVQRDAQGYLSVAYTDLAAVLVRAIQEQQARMDAQDEVIAALRAELTALREERAESRRQR